MTDRSVQGWQRLSFSGPLQVGESKAARLKACATPDLDCPEREIAATDEEIDELVYSLYGITNEERKIIES